MLAGLDHQPALLEGNGTQGAGSWLAPDLAIDEAADPPMREGRALFARLLGRRSGDHGRRAAQIPALQISAVREQRARPLAQVRRQLVAAVAQGLVGIQLGCTRRDLRQPQRRKLQRPLPTLRAHLVRGQVPAQLMRSEGQDEGRLAALPCLDEPPGVRQQISQEKKYRPFPGEAGRAAAQQRDGASSDVRRERRERDVPRAPQARHRLRRELDRQLLRLAMHVAEQGLRL